VKFQTTSVIIATFVPMLCIAAATKEDVARAWASGEAQREDYTASVKTSLQIFNKTQQEQIGTVERKIIRRRGRFCDIDAQFSDHVPVYGGKPESAIECSDLTSEFTSLHFDKVLTVPGWILEHVEGTLLIFEVKWTKVGSRNCEDGLRGRMSVDPSSLHPLRISLVAGDNCSASTVFKPGSKIDVVYEKLDGVYQMTSITEEHDLNAQPYDQARKIQFFWRDFTSHTHMSEPKARIAKTFFDFQRISRPFDIEVNPPPKNPLHENVDSGITFDEVK
jgi:hypothetical protein